MGRTVEDPETFTDPVTGPPEGLALVAPVGPVLAFEVVLLWPHAAASRTKATPKARPAALLVDLPILNSSFALDLDRILGRGFGGGRGKVAEAEAPPGEAAEGRGCTGLGCVGVFPRQASDIHDRHAIEAT